MTSSGVNPAKGFFSAVAGDAFLFSAALFALDMALAGGLMVLAGRVGAEGPVSVLGSFLGIVAVIAGAVVAWRLHGRDFNGAAPAGIALGIAAGAATSAVGFFALAGTGMAVGALTGSEFGGLIAVVVIAVLASLVIVVRLDIDAVRDLAPVRSEHRKLDVLRLFATGVLAIYSIGIAVAVYLNPASEIGEAILFAILAGTQAGLVTAFADWWVRREERKHAGMGAALSA